MQPGGQVATTVVACQTWGLRTRYVGKLGDDDAARLHKDAFRRVGAEAQIVTVPGAAACTTSSWSMRPATARSFASATSAWFCSPKTCAANGS